ncbi:hypothetical protein PTI98_008354 [Pleurotus ostreatus]|nr:hypothetical protein PTI98_008354 [Pleurotus ostreatus]
MSALQPPALVCASRSPSETGVREVAKVLRLLDDALDELSVYYKTLPIPPPVRVSSYGKKSSSGKHANNAARFPHWTSFRIGESEFTLAYQRRFPGETDYERTVFLAKMTSESIMPPDRDVVVKFTHRYSERGHRHLADNDLAPTLHHCAYVESVGMWVVVMDVVEGRTAHKGNKLSAEQGKSLRHAVELLHAKGLVFGDLREPNVIFKPNAVCLIDFEWCGPCEDVDGKGLGVRYPTDVAMGSDYDWAEGVGPDEFIRKAHDLYRLEQICGA